MKITEGVRRYAQEKGLSEEAAIAQGLKEKALEFQTAGEIYQKA